MKRIFCFLTVAIIMALLYSCTEHGKEPDFLLPVTPNDSIDQPQIKDSVCEKDDDKFVLGTWQVTYDHYKSDFMSDEQYCDIKDTVQMLQHKDSVKIKGLFPKYPEGEITAFRDSVHLRFKSRQIFATDAKDGQIYFYCGHSRDDSHAGITFMMVYNKYIVDDEVCFAVSADGKTITDTAKYWYEVKYLWAGNKDYDGFSAGYITNFNDFVNMTTDWSLPDMECYTNIKFEKLSEQVVE